MTTSGFGGAIEGRGASIDDPSNVLVSFPSMDDRERQACGELLDREGARGRDVIVVSISDSADQRVRRWRDTVGPLPKRLHIITAGDTAGPDPSTPDGTDVTVTTDSVSTPGDLTGLGIAISTYLDEHRERDARLLVCFDSVTALLLHTDLQPVYKFLHVLTAQLQSVDALAHFHLDPSAHGPQDVGAITSLFDTEITADDDGSIEVRSR
jgi:hypothetical protein